VLIVDDNTDHSQLLQEALTIAGHEVQTAEDGQGALELVHTFAPDIAFIDIGLPEMDGYELAGHLRAIPDLASTRLVAVTGYAREDDRRRAFASGFAEHLAKPHDVKRVVECIERLCPSARSD
jgi:CheY-like chemotaxis protein